MRRHEWAKQRISRKVHTGLCDIDVQAKKGSAPRYISEQSGERRKMSDKFQTGTVCGSRYLDDTGVARTCS